MASLRDLSQAVVELKGKTVFVTGASSGIGLALAQALAPYGCRFVLTARSEERLQRVARDLSPAETAVIPADLRDASAIAALCREAADRFGSIDILINSAGVGLYLPAHQTPPELVRQLFDLNVFAPVDLTRLLLPSMARGGAIVNISSIAGKVPLPWLSLYSASKYALNAYSDALRMELDAAGIAVLCVCPGYVDTNFRDNVLAGRIPEQVEGQTRFKITAAECAAAVVEGLRKDKRTVVTPRIGWALTVLARVFPRLVHSRLVRMHQGKSSIGDPHNAP